MLGENKKRILVVAAHPDDEILGCGGTIARFAAEGAEVFTLILGEGATSRYDDRKSANEGEVCSLQGQAIEVNKTLGVKDVFFENFPDNRFDSVDLLDVVKAVERVKNEIKPNIVFTHYSDDLNIDHVVTYNAVLTATRPVSGETVKEIYSFEVLSSTEWKYPLTFSPDIFVDIKGYISKKIDAMSKYVSELREFPHPRSTRAILANAEMWGVRTGCETAEAFKTVRVLR